MRLGEIVLPRACESRVCCSSGPGSGGPLLMEAAACSASPPPFLSGLIRNGESIASASDVPGPDEGGTQPPPDLRVTACLGCAVTSSGGSDGLNLLGGVAAMEAMGVGGAEVGVGGSDSDERKQTPVLAEEDQEGSCLGVFSGLLPLLAIVRCSPSSASTSQTDGEGKAGPKPAIHFCMHGQVLR